VHPLFVKASGLTHEVIGAAIEVHEDKGPGLLESIYEWCLTMELELRGYASPKSRPGSCSIQQFGAPVGAPLRFLCSLLFKNVPQSVFQMPKLFFRRS
jgi:hypothetical protein